MAYDQTPVEAEFRTPWLPDMDRYWLSFGGQYKVSAAGAIDFGYTHIFIKNGTIRDDAGGGQSQALQGVLISATTTRTASIPRRSILAQVLIPAAARGRILRPRLS